MYLFLALVTIVGLCVGSFCNVLIFRIPRGEEFVKTPSHCMTCGHRLHWYENIPLVSWLAQGGKCRGCGVKLSVQYPLVEAANGLLWLVVAVQCYGDWITMGLYCILMSMLLVLAVIDWRTFTIPNGINFVIFALGVIRVITDLDNVFGYLGGLAFGGGLFFALWFLTHGNGLGFGDVKLMFGAGLLIGFSKTIFALITGCLIGAVVHTIRMKKGAGRKLAFGPYLALGIGLSVLIGGPVITAYLSLFGL